MGVGRSKDTTRNGNFEMEDIRDRYVVELSSHDWVP